MGDKDSTIGEGSSIGDVGFVHDLFSFVDASPPAPSTGPASEPPAEPYATSDVTLLGVQSGGAYWLVDARSVALVDVPRITRVPLTPNWLRGLACVDGALLGVVDLAAFQGGALTPATHESRLLGLSREGAQPGPRVALLVGSVVGERRLAELESVPPVSEARPYLGGRYRDARGRIWQALDLARLVALPEFQDLMS